MKSLLCSIAVILLATSAYAANAPKPKPGVVTIKKTRQAALQLVEKMDTNNTLQMQTNILIDQQTASLSEIPCAGNAAPEVRKLLSEALDVQLIKNRMADVYINRFSLDELNWMLDFYETGLGKKLLAAQPELTRVMGEVSAERIKAAEPNIAAAIAVANKDSRCQMQLRRGR